jgi:methionine-rich copper-binding protein CopC
MGGARPRPIRRAGAALASVALGLLCVLVAASPAAAHNSLTGSDPKNGARLDQPPAQVRLTFLATLDPATTKIGLVGPDNVPAGAGAPRFDGKVVEVDFLPGRAGLYTVTYRVASDDGHPIEGEVRFTMTVGASVPSEPVPSVGTIVGPGGAPTTTPTAGPVGSTTLASPGPPLRASAEDDDGLPVWPFVLLGVGVLAALAGGAAVLAKRRRDAAGGPPAQS